MTPPLRAVLVDADGVLQFTAPSWRADVGTTIGDDELARHPRLLDEIAKAESPSTMTGEADLEHALTRVLDRHDVDLEPTDHLAFFQYDDRPGVVGAVGTLIGAAGINIAGMQVARSVKGGQALVAISVDSAIAAETLAEIGVAIEATMVRAVDLV